MHDGHRGRLLQTVNKAGLQDLSDIQKLEFILFYIIPRGDVNPLAPIGFLIVLKICIMFWKLQLKI